PCLLPLLRSLAASAYPFVFHTPPRALYTLSLHDALPIFLRAFLVVEPEPGQDGGLRAGLGEHAATVGTVVRERGHRPIGNLDFVDRKSTRLNSSHVSISYAVSCLKQKNRPTNPHTRTRQT